MNNRLNPDELVSIIVPAWNAERWIARTLASMEQQTHRHIEVLVIDDGSTDRTAETAQAWADRDPRFRVIKQENGGVASARNLGIRSARGRLVAPCDADDLWAPRKLEHQLKAWQDADPDVGLVYSWYVEIDADDRIQAFGAHLQDEGHVFKRMCQGNLIGNGSAAMFLREAALDVGGYDPTLRARGAQGCEDLKLYLQISKNYAFAVSKSYDVAYRHTSGNMSSNLHSMLKSYDIVMEEVIAQYPENAEDIAFGRLCFIDWLRLRALDLSRPRDFVSMQGELWRQDPSYAAKSLYWSFVRPRLRQVKKRLKDTVRGNTRVASEFKRGSVQFMGPSEKGALWVIGNTPAIPDPERAVP